ncbi:MAG: tRNA pseudouridine(13) synthase TruD [Desulfuromonadales bacterium]|nr:tRNA pseudouridine(13) synthase TruD [Desulfuromonadales bacterium]
MKFQTSDLPGTGGHYKAHPRDFQVEEIPLYPCSGTGEHLYLWVEKEGITTRELLRQLAHGLDLNERDIGYAGLKDARALTRQQLSVPANRAARLGGLRLRQAKILAATRHGNKLRLGHLAGNRFSIRLQDTPPDSCRRAEAVLQRLQITGVPNRFGEQRYGGLGNSHLLGKFLLQREYKSFCSEWFGDPQQISEPRWRRAAEAFRAGDLKLALELLPHRMRDEQRLLQALLLGKPIARTVLDLPRHLLRLFLSAYQSHLFNHLLEQRLPRLGHLESGDLAIKHSNGACFRVEDAHLEQPRADRFEISPSAPLFGCKVLLAEGPAGEREGQLLAQEQLTLADWKLGAGLTMPGERRPLRVPLDTARVVPADNGLQLEFSLPKGSYATSVLYEVIKPAGSADDA